jgi:hypothetical protein
MDELFLGNSLIPLCIDEVGFQQFEIKIQNMQHKISHFYINLL